MQAEEGGDGGDVPGVFVTEPVGVQGGEIGVVDFMRSQADLHRKVQHGALARRDVGRLAVIDGHLVGHVRLFLVDAQQRAVCHHAVQALVGCAGGGDDHLAVALAQVAAAAGAFGLHQRVVVGEEGAPFGRAARQAQEHVRHKAGFFLHGQHLGLDVVGQGVQVGKRVTGGHGRSLLGVHLDTGAHTLYHFGPAPPPRRAGAHP